MTCRPCQKKRAGRFPYYAVLLYVGLVSALAVADQLARRGGIDSVRLVAAFLVSMPVALAGARALEVLQNFAHYAARPREVLRLRGGGAAMYGALPPVALLSIPLAGWIGISFGSFWDIALVSILAGMIPTRLGCLGAGCCAGRPTASVFGLVLRNARGVRARRFPSPLFEALLAAVLLALSLALWGRLPFDGAMGLVVCAGYGAGRFALEELREERAPRLAGLGAYQWLSAALVLLGVGGLALGWARAAHAPGAGIALASESAGSLHLAVSALLLLPVVHLFRFLGCDLIWTLEGPPDVFHSLQMIVFVPDLGTGPATVRMQFLREPGMTEIAGSPFELAAAGTLPDGRLNFEAVNMLPQAAYVVNCTMSRADALTRTGTCSGELSGPGLVVAFNAEIGSTPNTLQPRLCFEAL